MRQVRPILWFWLAFAIVAFVGSVRAETIPATHATGCRARDVAQTIKPTACEAVRVTDSRGTCTNDYNIYTGPGLCKYTVSDAPWPDWGTVYDAGWLINASVYVCPSNGNWTLDGQNCTRPDCAAGETRNETTGACEAPCGNSGATWNGLNCACPGIQTYNATNKTCDCGPRPDLKDTSIGGTGTAPATTCYSNCTATVGGLILSSGGQWVGGLGSFTGTKCTPSPTTPEPTKKTPTEDTRTPEQKCIAAGGGYITTSSGTVCTSAGESPQPITTKKTATTETKDAAGNVTGTTETTTECVGSQCTTSTVTKDANGNVTGSTNGTGTGDKEGPDECALYPDRIGCKDLGNPSDGENVGEQTRGPSSITPVAVTGNASCPADIPLPKGMAFSFEQFCNFATGLRPVIIALAWLSAGFLLFGFRID